MPPKNNLIKHAVINSIEKEELKKRTKIDASVIYDTFDFEQKRWEKDSFNETFLKDFGIRENDLVLLQATRVVPRKAIEVAIDFAQNLKNNFSKLENKIIYNGKKISKDSRIVLILAGYSEKEDKNYIIKLKEKAKKQGVFIKTIHEYIDQKRENKNIEKKYSLWDTYVFADVVTFPSIWEGWGNQFIEAVFAEKPIVVFEYPVFKKDIKKEGYEIISLGDEAKINEKTNLYQIPQKNINKAVDETTNWLLDKNLEKKLKNNFKIGKKYHSYEVLEKHLKKNIK